MCSRQRCSWLVEGAHCRAGVYCRPCPRSRRVGLFIDQLLWGLNSVAHGHTEVLPIRDEGDRSVQLGLVWQQNDASTADDVAGSDARGFVGGPAV